MSIQQRDTRTTGDFTFSENGVEKGKLNYSWVGIDKLVINHTGVYPEFEHHGVGQALVEAVVDFARKKDIKIIPVCSFARSLFRENNDWKDVLA